MRECGQYKSVQQTAGLVLKVYTLAGPGLSWLSTYLEERGGWGGAGLNTEEGRGRAGQEGRLYSRPAPL